MSIDALLHTLDALQNHYADETACGDETIYLCTVLSGYVADGVLEQVTSFAPFPAIRAG